MNIVRYAVLSLAAVSTLPQAFALSTATISADIKFSLSSSVGTLGVSTSGGDVETYVDVSPIDIDADAASGTVSSAFSFVGANTATASTKLFEGHSAVSIGVPAGDYAEADAWSEGFAKLTLSGVSSGLFNLTISPFAASISKNLLTDSTGIYAFGGGGFAVTLAYTTTRAGGFSDHRVLQTIEIESSDLYVDTYSETSPFSFSNIPVSAANIELSWSTFAFAEVETRQSVPDAGSTSLYLGIGALVLGALRPLRRQV